MTEVRLVWDRETGQYVDPAVSEMKPKKRDKRRERRQADFLRGPIPMTWLERACQLPGKTANVGIALWYIRGFKQGEPFNLSRTTLARFGIRHPDVYYRALGELEKAGLVQVTRARGRALRVAVLLPERAKTSAV